MRSRRTVYKSKKFPMPLHHKENDESSLDTMPMQHKGDCKSSLGPMELHQKELDRSSLGPLSFGFTYDAPSYQSCLDQNPVWNHFHVALVLVILDPTQRPPMELRHKEGDRSSLEPLSFGISSGTPSYQSTLDPMQVHHKGAYTSSMDSMEPQRRRQIQSGTPSHQSSLDPNPVWIQCQCTIKEMANPVWI